MNKKSISAIVSAAVGSLVVAAGAVAAGPISLLEFATKNLGWSLAAEVPLQERLGAVAFRGDRAAGAQDGLEFYTDPNVRKFDRWCRQHGGKVAWESGDAVMGKTAGLLWPTRATKQDASWVCNAKDGSVIAAVLRGATREVQVPYWGGGMVPGYEFRYALFDGPSWAGLPARRDAELAAGREKAAAASAAYQKETARLRSEPKVGDWTSLGLIVEVKPPLVLIQVKENRRKARNASQEWAEIKTLEAPPK